MIYSYFDTTLSYLLGDDVGRYPTDPDYETLVSLAMEDSLDQVSNVARMFLQLSEPSKRIVIRTLAAAYKEDKAGGNLQQNLDVEIRLKNEAVM